MEIPEIKQAMDKLGLRLERAEHNNRNAKITLYRVMTGNYFDPIPDQLEEKIVKASIDYGKTGVRLMGKDLELIAEKKYE